MKIKKKLYTQKKKRYLNKIFGTINKPRLSVFKSHKHIYTQLINDELGKTLASYSSINICKNQKKKINTTCKTAYIVGEQIALLAIKQEISKVVFDRGIKAYIGKIASIAQGARNKGLKF